MAGSANVMNGTKRELQMWTEQSRRSRIRAYLMNDTKWTLST
jgi:hypothetical protein